MLMLPCLQAGRWRRYRPASGGRQLTELDFGQIVTGVE
jgi:hypothetical protein